MQERSPARGREAGTFSLVFPTFNPGSALDSTWRQVTEFLASARDSWEIVFVCDGCTDGTPERLGELCRDSPYRIRTISYAPNRGKGYAVQRGLEAARGEWRLFTDVDLAYHFEDVVRVAEVLRNGAEVAIASRAHPASRLVVPAVLQGYAYRRYLQSLVFSTLVRWLLPLPQRDTQAGLKGMSARIAELVLPHLRCNGFGFDCELLTACACFGVNVEEVPVWVHFEDRVSTTGARPMIRMLRELWQIRGDWKRAPLPLPVQKQQKAA
jgi:glycosyltransferase involved in cell wall biosynthesis